MQLKIRFRNENFHDSPRSVLCWLLWSRLCARRSLVFTHKNVMCWNTLCTTTVWHHISAGIQLLLRPKSRPNKRLRKIRKNHGGKAGSLLLRKTGRSTRENMFANIPDSLPALGSCWMNVEVIKLRDLFALLSFCWQLKSDVLVNDAIVGW